MQATSLIWMNGQLVPWNEAKVHILVHGLHYGTAVFEGIRMYATERGPAIFHLDAHLDRLFYSAKSIGMQVPYSQTEFKQAVLETVRANKIESCYIRPIIYYGFGELAVIPKGCPVDAAIALWPWGAYLGDEPARIKVSDVIRIHPKTSVVDAKITGHYVNAMLAGQKAVDQGYTEALLLDYEGNVAEGPGENFFMAKNGQVITPPLGTILAGITRKSVIQILKDMGQEVVERAIPRDEIYTAEECFFTGTAAEVTPIASIDDRPLPQSIGPVSKKLKEAFDQIVRGKNPQYLDWLTFVAD